MSDWIGEDGTKKHTPLLPPAQPPPSTLNHSGAPVTLDAAALDRVKKESPSPAAFKPEDEATATAADAAAAPAAGARLLTEPQARAVVLARALSLANGNSRVR